MHEEWHTVFLFAKKSGTGTPSVTEIYIVNSGLTQLGMLAIVYSSDHLGLWHMFLLPTHVPCASSVARYVSFSFQASSGKVTTLACWHCLPQNVPEERHVYTRNLQPVPD